MTWAAFGWALTESLCGVTISTCLLVGFRTWIARRSRLGDTLTANAYAAYVVHAPLVVAIAVLVSRAAWPPLAALVSSALLSIPLTFALAAALRRVPGVTQVL